MPNAACQLEQTVVDNSEDVVRICFKAEFPVTHDGLHPSDVDPATSLYRLEELQWQDFAGPARGGFSVQRTSLFSRPQADRLLENRISARSERGKPVNGLEIQGLVAASVGNIHSVAASEGTQVFFVYERPTENDPSHAGIEVFVGCKKAEFLKYRVTIQKIFGQLEGF